MPARPLPDLIPSSAIHAKRLRIDPILSHLSALAALLTSSTFSLQTHTHTFPSHYAKTPATDLVELLRQTGEVMVHIYERVPTYLTAGDEAPIMSANDRRIVGRVAEFLRHLGPFARALGLRFAAEETRTVHDAQGDAVDLLKGETPGSFVVAKAVEAESSASFVPRVPGDEGNGNMEQEKTKKMKKVTDKQGMITIHPAADSLESRNQWRLPGHSTDVKLDGEEKESGEEQEGEEEEEQEEDSTEPESDDRSLIIPDYQDEELSLVPVDPLHCRDFIAKPTPLPIPPGTTISLLLDDSDEESEADSETDLPISSAAAASISRVAEEQAKAKAAARIAADRALRIAGILRPTRTELFSKDAVRRASELQKTLRSLLPVKGPDGPLTGHDFATLVGKRAWLNDAIVDAALGHLDRVVNLRNGAVGYPKAENRNVLIMGSFFFASLVKSGGKNTERALRRKGVTPEAFIKLETVLIPVCQSSHWTLLVVKPGAKMVAHMDSLRPQGSLTMVATVRAWLTELLGVLEGDGYGRTGEADGRDIVNGWERVGIEAPVQDNGYDCGVFTILNAVSVVLGLEPGTVYRAVEMERNRWNLASMLVNGGFEGVFDIGGL